jgi:uncharacterized protein (TIGR03435 family)
MKTSLERTGSVRKLFLMGILSALTSTVCVRQLVAQSPNESVPHWQTAAGGTMVFDVATVRQNTTSPPKAMYSGFPLGPGDVYVRYGGTFRAANLPLVAYIVFAYKINPNQEESLLSQLPEWATTDRFDIQGQAQGNPTKDQMRLMMQSLLADRFHLIIRYETRQVSILALTVDQPGKLGPLLRKHPDDSPCATSPVPPSPPPTAPPQLLDTRFPATCGGILRMPASTAGRFRSGARNVTMELIANSMADGEGIDRPVLDKTGLEGMFDYSIEFTPRLDASSPPGANTQRDLTGPKFQEALREQLGLKLEPQMGPMDFLVISYVAKPSAN